MESVYLNTCISEYLVQHYTEKPFLCFFCLRMTKRKGNSATMMMMTNFDDDDDDDESSLTMPHVIYNSDEKACPWQRLPAWSRKKAVRFSVVKFSWQNGQMASFLADAATCKDLFVVCNWNKELFTARCRLLALVVCYSHKFISRGSRKSAGGCLNHKR